MKKLNHLLLLLLLFLLFFPWEAPFPDKKGSLATVVRATTSARAVELERTGRGGASTGASGGGGNHGGQGGSGNHGDQGGSGNRGGDESDPTGSRSSGSDHGSGMPILGSTNSDQSRNKGRSSKTKSGAARSFGSPRLLGLLPLAAVLICWHVYNF